MGHYYEVWVEEAAHDWDSRAIAKFAPKGQQKWGDGPLHVVNTRVQALAMRNRIMKAHPEAVVRLFEAQTHGPDEEDTRMEDEFVKDADGIHVHREAAKRSPQSRGKRSTAKSTPSSRRGARSK